MAFVADSESPTCADDQWRTEALADESTTDDAARHREIYSQVAHVELRAVELALVWSVESTTTDVDALRLPTSVSLWRVHDVR